MDENWVLETSPWISYDLSNWEPLIRNLKPVLYKKKSFLFHQNDPAAFTCIVKSGRVRVTSFNIEGIEKQLYIAEAGCCIGEISCIMENPHAYSAIAIVDTLVYRITSSEIIEAIRNDWELNKRVYNSVFRKMAVFQNHILELCFGQAIERIARLLLNLCKQYGPVEPVGCRIAIHFTHSDVASMVNTSRVTVSNIFTWLMDNGYLHRQDRYFVVDSTEKLERIAEGGIDLNRYLGKAISKPSNLQ